MSKDCPIGQDPTTFNFLGFVHLCARNRGEVQGEDHRQATGSRAKGRLAMVQTTATRSCERAAENPERQAPRPLPVLGTTVELPGNSAVLCESPAHLEGMAATPDTWETADLGPVWRHTPSAPAPTTSDHTSLAERRGSRLKNPLREICSVGSVRGEN